MEPIIPLHVLSPQARAFAGRIVCTQGKNKGRIKTSRPESAEDYFVWRMVRFMVSPDPRASCMPVAASYVLPSRSVDHDSNACERSIEYQRTRLPQGTNPYSIIYREGGHYNVPCSCDYEQRKAEADRNYESTLARLNAIVDEIVATVPTKRQFGVRRWIRTMYGVDIAGGSGDITDPVHYHIASLEDEIEGALL